MKALGCNGWEVTSELGVLSKDHSASGHETVYERFLTHCVCLALSQLRTRAIEVQRQLVERTKLVLVCTLRIGICSWEAAIYWSVSLLRRYIIVLDLGFIIITIGLADFRTFSLQGKRLFNDIVYL